MVDLQVYQVNLFLMIVSGTCFQVHFWLDGLLYEEASWVGRTLWVAKKCGGRKCEDQRNSAHQSGEFNHHINVVLILNQKGDHDYTHDKTDENEAVSV